MIDQVYIQRVLNGELGAFTHLVDEYKDQALSLAIRIVKDTEVAEDIVQDSFVNAYTNLKKFRGDASFKSWLYRIVYNESIMYLRRINVEHKHEKGVKDSLYGQDSSTFDSLKLHDQQRIIEEIFAKMNYREAAVLQLFYLEELSLKEIEEVVEIKKEHLKVILHRARKNFYSFICQTSENELIGLI